ncbi:MAG: DUF1499 domain-containing protein, partial [Methylococcus sp.]
MKMTVVAILCAGLLVSACAGERPANLGVTNGTLTACPDSPNCVSSQAGDERHRIEPLAT